MSHDTRSSVERAIDAACGITPEMSAKLKERALDRRAREARQAAIMTDLLSKVEAWYAVNS